MVRFIFVCMSVVALSILTVSAQFMVNSIKDTRSSVLARNTVEAPAQQTASDSLSFEEIYAMMPTPAQVDGEVDPAMLNDIETAAGGDEFSSGFTGVAPRALGDDMPAQNTNADGSSF